MWSPEHATGCSCAAGRATVGADELCPGWTHKLSAMIAWQQRCDVGRLASIRIVWQTQAPSELCRLCKSWRHSAALFSSLSQPCRGQLDFWGKALVAKLCLMSLALTRLTMLQDSCRSMRSLSSLWLAGWLCPTVTQRDTCLQVILRQARAPTPCRSTCSARPDRAVDSDAGLSAMHHMQQHERMASSAADHRTASAGAPVAMASTSGTLARGPLALRTLLSSRIIGPASLAAMLAYCTALVMGAWRYFFRDRTRNCTACRGYGITRCDICIGSGAVQWEGKWGHVEPCPRCVGRRHMRCRSCQGFYHKPLFDHVRRTYGGHAAKPTRTQRQERAMRDTEIVQVTRGNLISE